jgi:hypothetical protein
MGFNEYKIIGDGICEFYIKSTKGNFVILVDEEDLDRLIKFNHRWVIWERNNYAVVRTNLRVDEKIGVRTPYLHRWLLNVDYECAVDHINHNTLDNRKCNLRITNDLHNTQNRKSKNKNNKSGYRNVMWDKKRKRWSIILSINKKPKYLDSFDDVHEAGRYAEEMRQKYYGEFAGKN